MDKQRVLETTLQNSEGHSNMEKKENLDLNMNEFSPQFFSSIMLVG